MGAYLSEPLTTKDSSDESNEFLASGSSSMQGWRISQEDAHNCILNFDDQCSFFAVYDGHGGAEVAQYCSLHLPTFLKTVEAYGRKEFEKALKEAFLGFDATLLQEKVIEELKVLSDKTNGEDEADEEVEEEEEDDNVEDLCKEAVMPLNEVLQKYRKDTKPGEAKNQRVAAIKEGSCSKPVSPYLKGKRRAAAAGNDAGAGGSSEKRPVKMEGGSSGDSAGSDAEADPADKKQPPQPKQQKEEEEETVPGAADSTVSSSSNKAVERVKEATPQPEPSSSSSSSSAGKVSPGKSEPVADGGEVAAAGSKKAEQSDEISDTAGNVAAGKSTDAAEPGKDNCAPDSSSSDGSKQQASKLNGDLGKVGSSGAVSSSSSSGSAGPENGSCDSGSGGSGGAAASASASPAAKVHSSSAKPSPKNGPPPADVSMSMDDTDDDDDDDDESDSDEEFPHAEEPADDTSSTDEGEEDAYGEEGSAEEEEEEPDEYADMGEYINEEDAAFMKTITDEPGKDSGCTAVVALLHGKDLYVANAGDSRCVVCRNGKALEMSFDHKPEDTVEYQRIEKAGGRVTLDGRVNGGLNLSRAIGDHGYKMNKSLPAEEQMISALPDIEKITVGPEDDFMVLACDGIWNFMTSEQVVQFVQERINKPGMKLSKICEELFDHCLAPHTRGDGTGCDNMTAIIVQFKPNFTGAGSRKRTASNSVASAVDGTDDADGVSSATKKVKTDGDDASSTTEVTDGSNGVGKEADATEAAAAVASIADEDSTTTTTTSTAAAASSEAASSST
ncbi:protein phosphatase 1G [Anopheles gambiae]|uniref:protein phosphatase 1G n=1 Tax=Anopheles coluzzii TaxID=1518534 RepID=UPI0020FFC80E|nr:protein phosphatase 1G [Anopheles coluzzii]XP_061504830.1 protein phosphatase 1G [Anopheles gambiae]